MEKNILRELGEKYNSSKITVGCYEFVYDDKFDKIRNEVKKFLEIGIYEGASLRMWKDYFPNATIYGLDVCKKLMFEEDRIITRCVDQGNENDLKKFIEEFGDNYDIIMDDGSHFSQHQQISFSFLLPYLKSKGIYVIEDLHCCFGSNRFEKVDPKDERTTYNVIKRYIETKVWNNSFLNEKQEKYLTDNILTCDLCEIPNKKIRTLKKSITCIFDKK